MKVRKKKRKVEKEEKQIRTIFIMMVCLVLLIFLVYLLIESTKKFEYIDLEFRKVKKGDLNLYYTKFPVRDLSGEIRGYRGFYFREDPRALEDIKIDGKIKLKKDAALAADSDISGCEDSILAASTLTLFLQTAGVKSFGATTDKVEAIRYGRSYVNCGEKNSILLNDYTIISFKESNETRIEQRNNGCYIINVANCDIMNATERFMMGVYAHSRGIEI